MALRNHQSIAAMFISDVLDDVLTGIGVNIEGWETHALTEYNVSRSLMCGWTNHGVIVGNAYF